MELKNLIEKHLDLPRLSKDLDELGHPARVWATRQWTRSVQAKLYEAVKGFRPVTLDDYVPPGIAPHVEVIHHGMNTLPAHNHFQKRFTKPADPETKDQLVGFNYQGLSGLTGPGYYVAHPATDAGEVDVDYTMLPKEKPDAWPPIVPNSERLGRFVYYGMIDVMRGISSHVSIGRARKKHGWMDAWFVLVREDPQPDAPRLLSADDVYTLRILDRVQEIPQATWDGMLRAESSPFLEHAWLDMLEQTGCVGDDTGWMPAHLSLWKGDALVAVAPSYVKGHSEGEFVFDWNWADLAQRLGVRYYPKVLVAVPFTPATGDRVLVAPGMDRALATRLVAGAAREWCGRFKGGGVHVLFPREPAEEGESAWEQAGYLRREGFQFHWFRHGATTFDEYLARFTSKQRNQIKRELRGVADRGVTVETLAPEAHTREVARAMHGFYVSTIENHGRWGRMYLSEAFFDAVVDRFRDRLAWVVARDRHGEPVAGAFNVVKDDRLYGRYWGASVQVPYLHFVVCYYAGIRHAIERGLDVFEPGAGGEHKRARGFVPTLTHSFHWLADGRMRSVIGQHLERERARVREHVASEGRDGGDDGP